MENKEQELPDINTPLLARMLAYTLHDILNKIGISSKFIILHEHTTELNPEALVEALRKHTMALSYIVPKFGLTELYVESRKAEQEKLEAVDAQDS